MKKAIKIITVTLAIILISMVSFVGIYTQKQNHMENIVKEYEYAMDLEGARIAVITPKDETNTIIKDAEGNTIDEELTDEEIAEKGYTKEEVKINDGNLNIENFQKSKEIVKKRLEQMGVENYNIALNEQTGEIKFEIEEDSTTNDILRNVYPVGKFEIADNETGEVLLDNQYIKDASVLYGSESTGTSVYLQIELNKEGTAKLEEITNTYKKQEETETTENTTEGETETEENTETQKEIKMTVDTQTLITMSFEEPIRTGKIQLNVGSASTDAKTVNGYAKTAVELATLLDNGKLPIEYEITGNEFIYPEITKQDIQYIVYAIAGISVIALIFIIIKYKLRGLIASIAFIGYAALYLLLIRYANVMISLEGICAIIITLAANYILSIKIAQGKDKKELITFFSKIIPIPICSIVFSFMEWIPIASFGMILFWGTVLMLVFNGAITKPLVDMIKNKE